MSDITLTPPLRLHHASGGVGILVGDNGITGILAPGDNRLRLFRLPSPNSARALLKGYDNLRVLARTTFNGAKEMHDAVTDHFVLAILNDRHKCLATEQEHWWGGIAHAFHEDDCGADGITASRVATQIHVCVRRLERLSMAYRTVLSHAWEPPSAGSKPLTGNKYAQHIGNEFRSILNELFSLRDSVNSAVARFKYGQTDGLKFGTKFRTAVLGDPTPLGRLLADSYFDETGDLLLDRMSLYRAVTQHCLGRLNPLFGGDVYQTRVSRGRLGDIGYVVFPLYDDAEHMRAIERGSSKGILQQPSREESKRFLAKETHQDALEFSFDCLERLLRIAQLLATETALPSRMMTIPDADIVSATFTDEEGNTTHLKRDGTTGELVEC